MVVADVSVVLAAAGVDGLANDVGVPCVLGSLGDHSGEQMSERRDRCSSGHQETVSADSSGISATAVSLCAQAAR
jgi:hypothetical protein